MVVAHPERATLRVGDVFLKVDTDRARIEREIEAIALVPVPTPEILWHEPPVLALSAVRGTVLARLGRPSTSPRAAWVAAGTALRRLHDAPLPPWTGRDGGDLDELTAGLDAECEWLVADGLLPADLVTRNRQVADAALRPFTPAFTHGDLHIAHVFADGDELTGIIDWSEAGQGDPLRDVATMTLGHPEHLDDVLTGYGTEADPDIIRAWWSLRTLLSVRWLIEHNYDPFTPGGEVDVLKARM